MKNITTTTYTPEQLVAMSDDDFDAAVTENLQATSRFKSPFQTETVVQRTLLALIGKLWFSDSQLARQAEDPDYPIERYEKSLAFRRHLLSVIDQTERRVGFLGLARETRAETAWKALLHEVCDELEDGPESDILDSFDIPFAEGLTLRAWVEIRRVKDPSRVKTKELAAA